MEFRLKEDVRECKNITFEQMDITKMRYEDQTFDTVVMYNAIAHIDPFISEAVIESKRVLKEGGHIDIVSSFKMDKAVIEEQLIPYLKESGDKYTVEEDRVYTYVRIEKKC